MNPHRTFSISATLLICLLIVTSAVQAQQPGWSVTGSLAAGRNAGQRAVLLANGKVLVVGPGSFGSGTPSPELYDPATGQWSVTGSMGTARSRPVLLRLANGKVLAAGGAGDTSAEIYDPETGVWSATGSLSIPRLTPAGVLLGDGRVLITGGTTSRIAEVYDPVTAAWSPAGTMTAVHLGVTRPDAMEHTSTLLPDGTVLVVGGSAELYDPATGSWTATGDVLTPRFNHTATLLPNGKVLVAAGSSSFGACPVLSDTAELYDPATRQWSAAGRLTTLRGSHKATLLPNGKVLVVGEGAASPSCFALASSELYDPATDSWSDIGGLTTVGIPLQAVLLANGKVLAIGGNATSAELFDSGTASFSLPHFVFGGGWSTSLYFSNTTGSAASFQVNFFDNAGAPLSVPLNGAGSVSTLTIALDMGGAVILEAPNVGNFAEGWAEAMLPLGLTGYAVFRQSIPGRADQEALVPLTPESNTRTANFGYDDVNTTTAVAFLNPSSQQVTGTITVYREDGAQAGSNQLTLSPRSKQSAILRDLPGLSGVAGNLGDVAVSMSNGTISVLGLRFGGEAFTRLPVTHGFGAMSSNFGTLPQVASGGSWHTAVYLSNTTDSAVNLQSFFDSSLNWGTLQLNPRSTVMLETLNTGDLVQNWGSFLLPGGAIGYAVFRQSIPGRADQEAAVPLTPPFGQVVELIYDDTDFTSTFALANPRNQQIVATVIVYGADGSQIGSSQLTLGPASNTAAILRNLPGLAGTAGRRGRATFSADSGPISVVGFRFGGEAFTSIPVTQR